MLDILDRGWFICRTQETHTQKPTWGEALFLEGEKEKKNAIPTDQTRGKWSGRVNEKLRSSGGAERRVANGDKPGHQHDNRNNHL